MGKFYSELDENLTRFVLEQKLFFTGTAPVDGRINISPKGLDCLRVIDNKTVAYLDLTGSGNETAAHIHENGRMTIMFCSFAKKPMILRLYGRGEVVKNSSDRWRQLSGHFPSYAGERQIVVLHIESAQTSCGFGVPVADNFTDRDLLTKPGDAFDYEKYWREKNQTSIDGLPTKLF